MDCSMPGFSVHHQLPEPAQTHVHPLSDAIQPSHPVVPFSSCLQSFPASRSFPMSQFFASGGQLELQLQHQSFQWIFRTDLLYKSLVGSPCSPRNSQYLLQHHSSKALVLRRSAFFMVQLSHPYMTTGKTIALTKQTFVSKVMSLLFNMLSRFIIAFLPRSKHLLISWLQAPCAVVWEPKKIKSVTITIVFPSICQKWWTVCHDLCFLKVEF